MILKYTFKLISLLVCLIIAGCHQHSDNISAYMENYSDIANKKIFFSEDPKNLNEKVSFNEFTNSKLKLICTGYMSCSPCVSRLIECEDFISHNEYLIKNLEVLYIVFGEKSDYFDFQLKQNNFSFPILYDSCSSFLLENGLENYDKSVFLVSRKNKIILIGSPFNNTVLKKYYKQCIQENE